MSNVDLIIAGRRYTVACADGEENHISELGRIIDAKLTQLGNVSGHGEARTLLFAALLLADELQETKGQVRAAADSALSHEAAERIDAIAAQLEKLAGTLETQLASS